MVFIDIHAHIEMCKSDVSEIVERAGKKGVKIIVNNSVDVESNRRALEFSAKHKEIKAAFGFYPINALTAKDSDIDAEIDFIRENKDKVIAIGEVGLDYKEDEKNHERQKGIFKKFIELSIELDVPIIVHSRKSELDCIELLEKMKAKKVIMHCFSGNFSLVERIIKNGWFFSIPANVVFSEHFQKIAEKTDISQLMCETDSPYLHPVKGRYDNEPMNVIESYRKMAEIKGISLKECENKIEENYKRLFGVVK